MKSIILSLFLFVCSCSSFFMGMDSSHRGPEKHLSERYAQYRAQGLGNINYFLKMDLTDDQKFSGVSTINFDLEKPKDLTIDFMDGKVSQVIANGKSVLPVSYNSVFIEVPAEFLSKGQNSISITFSHPYSNNPSGLYRFVDPVDQKVYLYTNFEPYRANKMFPCFDQPDLKATFESKVTTPKNWHVVTSNRESKIDKLKSKLIWHFPKSKKFSTYIFSLHAGEYKVWESEAKTKNHVVPLRLFARQSLAKYVDIKEWFPTTQAGFRYFEDFFATPYPFEKYDQLIVPEFFSGAMENVGAVAFHEFAISRTTKERKDKRTLANTLLHELAHMWFGNLVTMQWWNDLWLNESFATYLAAKAVFEVTPYKESWTEFYINDKRNAYTLDQSVATHPVTFDVPNTEVVFANFDGITYGKGASTLKQLEFRIGNNAFKNGLKSYFKKHAYKNTRLKDFMEALSTAYGKDLSQWEKDWLKTSQLNSIELEYKCQNGKIENAFLKQSAPKDFPTLRQHRTQFVVLQSSPNKMIEKTKFSLDYQNTTTAVPSLNGTICDKGTLIYPNFEDFDYVKVILDANSLKSVEENISRIDNELLRISLWSDLWEMVRDRKVVATQFLQVALKNLKNESNVDILTTVSSRVHTILKLYMPPTEKGKMVREQYRKQWSAFLLQKTKRSRSIDEQKRWFDFYLSTLETKTELDQVSQFLEKKPKWLKFQIDQERRWNLLKILSSFAYKNIDNKLQQELKKDNTQRGQGSFLAAKTLYPSLKVKKEKWSMVIKGPQPTFPIAKMNFVIGGLFPSNQNNLHSHFEDIFYNELIRLKDQPAEFLLAFTRLAPRFCTPESASKLKRFVDNNTNLNPVVVKNLKLYAERDQRCVNIRKLIAKSLGS